MVGYGIHMSPGISFGRRGKLASIDYDINDECGQKAMC